MQGHIRDILRSANLSFSFPLRMGAPEARNHEYISLLPRFVMLRRLAGRTDKYSSASGIGARSSMRSAGCESTCPYSVMCRPASPFYAVSVLILYTLIL